MGGIQHPCRDRPRQGRRIGEWIDDIPVPGPFGWDGQCTDGLKRYLRPPDEFLHALLSGCPRTAPPVAAWRASLQASITSPAVAA